ncbi:MAG: hypothetical protein GQ527_02095 [Bacteroidales bacterium]|nr:hypothetical protein [Bacteroidales bacterium]
MSLIKQNIKQLFVLFVVLAQFYTVAQVPMEKVLVEMGTATWNAACASEVQIINQMKDNGLQISVVNYHLNDPFANQYANQRASYYNIQNLPFPVVGGQLAEIGNYDDYLSLYNESFNTPSSFSISANGQFSEDTLILDVSIEKLAAYESDLITVYLAITESNIEVEWQGLDEVNEVERGMAPDGNGLNLDFSNTSIVNVSGKILFERDWNPENMELVVFIQDDTTNQILQCHSQLVPNFAPLPVHAFFQLEDTLSCLHEYVVYQNLSTGDVENVQWYFSGGTPNESNDYNPQIQYNETGAFQVELIVSNSISSDTLRIAEYINVRALPTVTFNLLPDFCHNQIIYQLTEGSPEGGNYFGLFVDTGYFHPEESGLGSHPIHYTYMDSETGCSDTLDQDAMVYFCESLNELSENPLEFPFHISKSSNSLLFQEKPNNSIPINKLQIYSIKGDLLFEKSFTANEEKGAYFLTSLNNPLLIIRVLTLEKTYLFKYQLM